MCCLKWKVYELTCKCGRKYIGQTNKVMSTRLASHFTRSREFSDDYQVSLLPASESLKNIHFRDHCKTIDDITHKVLISDIPTKEEAHYLESIQIQKDRISKELLNFTTSLTYSMLYHHKCLTCFQMIFLSDHHVFLLYKYFENYNS